jgi:hypothetical protein
MTEKKRIEKTSELPHCLHFGGDNSIRLSTLPAHTTGRDVFHSTPFL